MPPPPLTFRLVKGSILTKQEGDDNLTNFDTRIDELETNPPAAVSIDEITSDGASLTVVLTDASEQGPFNLPRPNFTPRGAWAPVTEYFYGNTVSANGGVYFVNIPHTSAASFDPGESDTSGAFYALMFEWPDNVLPTGGATSAKLKKLSATDYHVTWGFDALNDLTDVDIGTGAGEGDTLRLRSGIWVDEPFVIPAPTSGTGATLGGLFASDGFANSFVTHIDDDGNQNFAQPAFTDISGAVADSQLLQIKRQTVSQSGGTLTINRALGEIVKVTLTANVTSIVVNNWPVSGIRGKVDIRFTNPSSYTVTGYPSNTAGDTQWPGGTEPTITVSSTAGNGVDRIILMTDDAGATVEGNVVGQGYG